MSVRRQTTFRLAATALVLSALAWFLARNLRGLDLRTVNVSIAPLVAAFGFLQLCFLANVSVLRCAYSLLGKPIPLFTAYRVYFLSNLGRYIPGKVWQLLSMSLLAKGHGIAVRDSASVFVFNQVTAIAVGVLCVLLYGVLLSPAYSRLGFLSVAYITPVFAALVFPNVAVWGVNRILALLRRPLLAIRLPHRYVAGIAARFWLTFTLNGCGFLCLVLALGQPVHDPFFLIAVYPLAYIAGYLALITPGGVGVRESVVVILLKSQYSSEVASLVALASLVWFVAAEMINAGIAAWGAPGMFGGMGRTSSQDTGGST